jgi:trans-aconitate methyltransferase
MDREDWNRRWQERRLHCHADDPSAVLAAELGALAPGRALDLGCGAGRSSIWLAERGWQVTGVDFSDAALELARAARPDADWVLADLREYEPAAAAYDLVLLL